MESLSIDTIISQLQAQLGENIPILHQSTDLQQCIIVDKHTLLPICSTLQDYYFDHLAAIIAIDVPKEQQIEVIYQFYSIVRNLHLTVKIVLPTNAPLEVPSLTALWQTADWHEREVFDLFGVKFVGHTDLRRILLPADWEGHPLRKDYQHQTTYHGITVKY
jgi:NADH-quinone oxidoreductase subunit C